MAGPRQDRDLPKVKLTKDSLSEFKFLFKFLRPHRKYFIGGLIFISLSAFSTMTFPFLMGKMIDAVSGSNASASMPGVGGSFNLFNTNWSLNFVLLLIIVQLSLQTIFSFMRVYLLTKAGTGATADLRKQLYSKIISLPMSFFKVVIKFLTNKRPTTIH